MAKVTNEQKEEILAASGDESNSDVAKRVGVHHKTVEKVRREAVKTSRKIADGPTTGYRDGKNGVVEVANFADGYLPDGWHDNPAACDNCDGKSHPPYVKVDP